LSGVSPILRGQREKLFLRLSPKLADGYIGQMKRVNRKG